MRKQYHFWPGNSGLDAWDVHRLIALSSHFEVRDIEVSSLVEIDRNFWSFDESTTVRDLIDHMRLVAATDVTYPIILRSNGCVMDGMHRVVGLFSRTERQLPRCSFW